MLIRSQDRKSLVDMSNKSISIINNNILVFGFETDISVALGEYSTEEKAMKVLNEISRTYCFSNVMPNLDFEQLSYLDFEEMTKTVENRTSYFVFEMPQDNEV